MMQRTRRSVLKVGVGSLGARALSGRAADGAEAKTVGKGLRCLDYGSSFICNPSPANSVRFWVESRTTVIDEKAGKTTEYYQCASCKSERTFAEKDLLQQDNYDFLPIFGGGDLLIFRRRVWLNPNYRQVVRAADVWGEPILKLRPAREVTELTKWEQIRDATAAAIPIVTQTEIANEKTGLRGVIECPTKTMNISLEKKMYQVDTGPIAFPDLTKRYDRQIECLSLAFVVFNAPEFADFVVEQPTPVIEGDVEKCKVYHYSRPFSLPAKNRVFALAKA
jgi:hypothetical protein